MVLSHTDRVRANTAAEVNRRVDEQIERNIRHYSGQTKEEIYRRIQDLDREWDIERVLETMASSFSLTGIVLGATVDRKWFLVPTLVLSFLLVHAIQGWCPPLPILRSLGFALVKRLTVSAMRLKLSPVTLRESRKIQAGLSRRWQP
jgi:hypothetical protein